MNRFHLAAIASTVALAGGCALTSKGDALEVRYFTPETATAEPSRAAPSAARGPELRLGRVRSGRHLRDRIAYRLSPHELGYYEDRRWTERPEYYVQRELSHALFEERGLTRVVSGDAPTLDVEILAFEEVLVRGHHAARIVLHAVLVDGGTVRFEETLTVERPAADPGFGGVVTAMADALDAAVAEMAKRVDGALRARGPGAASTGG